MAPLLEVKDLTVHFPVRRGLLARQRQYVHAVDNASFTLAAGETLGLVGESGCGKTTTGLAILRLIPFTSGQVIFQGQDLSALSRPSCAFAGDADHLRPRSEPSRAAPFPREMQIIFQDPYSSLNPRMTVQHILSDPMQIHGRELPGEGGAGRLPHGKSRPDPRAGQPLPP